MIVVVATRSKTERAKFELSAKQKVSRWSLKNLTSVVAGADAASGDGLKGEYKREI
jgi:hypothetical protein